MRARHPSDTLYLVSVCEVCVCVCVCVCLGLRRMNGVCLFAAMHACEANERRAAESR